jgi:hypothetical protein
VDDPGPARAGSGSREERQAVVAADPWLVPERHRARYAVLIADASGRGIGRLGGRRSRLCLLGSGGCRMRRR